MGVILLEKKDHDILAVDELKRWTMGPGRRQFGFTGKGNTGHYDRKITRAMAAAQF
jgi:hypothetical protein